MSRQIIRKFGVARVLCVLLAASSVVSAQAQAQEKKPPAPVAKDMANRPVDLDLSRGVQAPPRDTSKLPTTFAGAAKTQPVDPKWGTQLMSMSPPSAAAVTPVTRWAGR